MKKTVLVKILRTMEVQLMQIKPYDDGRDSLIREKLIGAVPVFKNSHLVLYYKQ